MDEQSIETSAQKETQIINKQKKAARHITIPGSYKEIAPYAFKNASISSVAINEGVEKIGQGAFWQTSLKSVSIPVSVNLIEPHALSVKERDRLVIKCKRYSYADYYAQYLGITPVYTDYYSPAYDCNKVFTADDAKKLTGDTIIIPAERGYTHIANEAFEDRKDIRHVIIPEGITVIGDSCFSGCTRLVSVTLPSSLVLISIYAFWNCEKLLHIKIPDNVKIIGIGAFSFCSKLTLDCSENQYYNEYDGFFFGIDGRLLRCCPKKQGVIKIPSYITDIGNSAFTECADITEVILPDTIKIINTCFLRLCRKLTRVVLPDNIFHFKKEFQLDCNENIKIICTRGSITEETLKSCDITEYEAISLLVMNGNWGGCITKSGQTSVTFPNNATVLSNSAFSGNIALQKVRCNDSLQVIGRYSFSGCANLRHIELPESIFVIDEYAFLSCDLKDITIPKTVNYIGDGAFSNNNNLSLISMSEKYVIENGMLYGLHDKRLIWVSPFLEGNITIPDDIKTITACAFACCGSITGVIIPDSVEVIGDCAFMGMCSMKAITLPRSIRKIGFNVFGDCEKSLIINGYKDTVVEKYALENNLCFRCIEAEVK